MDLQICRFRASLVVLTGWKTHRTGFEDSLSNHAHSDQQSEDESETNEVDRDKEDGSEFLHRTAPSQVR